jgi:hypothetical protein
MDMVSDNDQIISDILAEMNNAAPSQPPMQTEQFAEPASFVSNSEAMYQQDQMSQFAHQVDPHSRIAPGGISGTPVNQIRTGSSILKMDSRQSLRRRMFQAMKQPLLVALCAYLLFNPFVLSQFQRIIPRIFGATDSRLIKHLRIIIISVLVAVLYGILSRFI